VKDLSTRVGAWIACALFILLGAALIPLAGIQNDEAIFTGIIYLPVSSEFGVRVLHHRIPLMVMSYIGALKTLVFWPILKIFHPNVYSMRVPTVLMGALTIWLVYKLVIRIGTPLAAVIAAFLLATDPTFLMTDTFDWGPVAFEHLLLVTACFAFVRFAQTPDLPGDAETRRWFLALGFLAIGLALWNKAIVVWALSGLAGAAVIVCWPEVRKTLTPANLRIAAAAFFIGCFPFVIYNLHRRNATFGSNAHIDSPANFPKKTVQMEMALDGSPLFGYLVAEQSPYSRPPRTVAGRIAASIEGLLGEHRSDEMLYALGVLVLAVPLWWPIRAARFALVFMAIAWTAMLFTRDAGTGTHHSVLIWPFPQVFIALILGAFRWRPVAIAVALFLAGTNLLVVNQYILQLDQNGADRNFTDAIRPLAKALEASNAKAVYTTDWGFYDTLVLLSQGHLPLLTANEPFMRDIPTDVDRQIMRTLFLDKGAIFVGHVPDRQEYPGVRDRMAQDAAAAGFRKVIIAVIPDSHSRPVFEIFRFEPS